MAAKGKMRQKLEDASSWDVSAWPSWFLLGRVLPERCVVNINPTECRAIYGSSRLWVKFECGLSHVSCIIRSDNPNLTDEELRDISNLIASPLLDSSAFAICSYYTLVMDSCTYQDGSFSTFSVSEPIFSDVPDGYLFNQTDAWVLENRPLPTTLLIPEISTALHDLSQSLRDPTRTLEHCRMALEAIRGYFDPAESSLTWRQRQAAGEKAMCKELRLSRATFKNIESYAAPSRHGSKAVLIDWVTRKAALEFSWEVVYRFILFIKGEDRTKWLEVV